MLSLPECLSSLPFSSLGCSLTSSVWASPLVWFCSSWGGLRERLFDFDTDLDLRGDFDLDLERLGDFDFERPGDLDLERRGDLDPDLLADLDLDLVRKINSFLTINKKNAENGDRDTVTTPCSVD